LDIKPCGELGGITNRARIKNQPDLKTLSITSKILCCQDDFRNINGCGRY
jgi:hypothetical protein